MSFTMFASVMVFQIKRILSGITDPCDGGRKNEWINAAVGDLLSDANLCVLDLV